MADQAEMSNPNRRLSVASLVNPTPDNNNAMAAPAPTPIIDENDEKVLIAVTALGHMRSSGGGQQQSGSSTSNPPHHHRQSGSSSHYWHNHSTTSTQATPSLSRTSSPSRTTSPSTRTLHDDLPSFSDEPAILQQDDRLLARVSNLPLVNTALRAYDYGKSKSRVINYGAGLVESSVKAISGPVIDRLPVDQLDEFACRQLDRLGKYGGKPESPEDDGTAGVSGRGRDRRPRSRQSSLDSSVNYHPSSTNPDMEEEDRSGVAPQAGTGAMTDDERAGGEPPSSSGREVQVANRRGWQTVLVEASGISAAISEENMKRLKYCLQWLQYATARIDQQMAVLQRFLASLETSEPNALVPLASMRTLTEVKKDVVATVRQVVEVMSKYAGGALPEQARATVRNFILLLPERWASAMQAQDAAEEVPAAEASAGPGESNATTASRAAKRVLTLANESLEMMRGATGVFSESLERAEAWVERLRIIGIQRQQQQQQAALGHSLPNSPGVNIQGLSISSNLGSRRPSHSDPDDDDDDVAGGGGNHTETDADGDATASGLRRRGRRQRRRFASPSPAATARLNGLIPGMQVE